MRSHWRRGNLGKLNVTSEDRQNQQVLPTLNLSGPILYRQVDIEAFEEPLKIPINLSVVFHDPPSRTGTAVFGDVVAGPDRLNSIDVVLIHKSRGTSQTYRWPDCRSSSTKRVPLLMAGA